MIGLLLSLAISASAVEAPFYIREAKSDRDVGSLNENFRATSDAIRRSDLTNGGTINGSLCFADGTCQTTAPSDTFNDDVTFGATSTITFTAGMGYSGIAGGIIASSRTISGATSTTISGLDGNRYGRIRIAIEGQIASAADAAVTKLHFNADTTNYRSEGLYGYAAGAGGIPAITNGLRFWRQFSAQINTIQGNLHVRTGTFHGLQRPYSANFGGIEQVPAYQAVAQMYGGVWKDTTTNITSITFVWAAAFTGDVYIYQD